MGLDTKESWRLWEAETTITCEGQLLFIGPAETQHRGGSLKALPAGGSVPEGWGLEGDVSRGKGQVDNASLALPQPYW